MDAHERGHTNVVFKIIEQTDKQTDKVNSRVGSKLKILPKEADSGLLTTLIFYLIVYGADIFLLAISLYILDRSSAHKGFCVIESILKNMLLIPTGPSNLLAIPHRLTPTTAQF